MSTEVQKLKDERNLERRKLKILEKVVISAPKEDLNNLKQMNVQQAKLIEYLLTQLLQKDNKEVKIK